MVAETEPAAPEATTHNDADYVYVRVSSENMTPVYNGLTEAVQCHVFQGARRQNAPPCLTAFRCRRRQPRHSSGVEIPATFTPRLSQSCSGGMIVYSTENDPHVEGLTKYLPGCHAVPGTSAAAENGVFVDCHRVSCLTTVFDSCNRGQNTGLPSATNTGGEYRVACVMGVAGRCKKGQQLLPSLFPFCSQVSVGGL